MAISMFINNKILRHGKGLLLETALSAYTKARLSLAQEIANTPALFVRHLIVKAQDLGYL
jgi:hypothetical protein